MNPTGEAEARYANVHFTGTERNRCLLNRLLLLPKHFSPSWAPGALLVTENWRQDSWTEREGRGRGNGQKEDLFILCNSEITWWMSGQWCVCVCILFIFFFQEAREDSLFCLFISKVRYLCVWALKYVLIWGWGGGEFSLSLFQKLWWQVRYGGGKSTLTLNSYVILLKVI